MFSRLSTFTKTGIVGGVGAACGYGLYRLSKHYSKLPEKSTVKPVSRETESLCSKEPKSEPKPEPKEESQKEKLDRCIKSSFSTYTVEKAGPLMKDRYYGEWNPMGMTMAMELIGGDVRNGVDGFSGKQIQQAPIWIFPKEVEDFSECMKGKEFAEAVAKVYEQLKEEKEADFFQHLHDIKGAIPK